MKAEAAAKKKEKDREFSESRLMSREDYDVGPEPPPVEEEKTPDTEVEVVEPPPAPVVLTGAKLKLFNIIAKLVASKSGQKDHPRKNNNPQYFMPLTFGRDMRFDPFALNQHWDGPPNLNDDDEDEDSMPKVGYDDITKAIQERKNAIEKRKKDQLYQLNNPDVPSKDWTPMFRVDPIDWNEFFNEEYQLLQEKLHGISSSNIITPNLSINSVRNTKVGNSLDFNKQLEHSESILSEKNLLNVTYILGTNTTTIVDEKQFKKELIPLPFGKVVNENIIFGHDCYFQIEMEDASAILTIELNYNEINVDLTMDLACGYYPTPLKNDIHASKSSDSQTLSIVYRPIDKLNGIQDGYINKNLNKNDPIVLIVGVHMKTINWNHTVPFSIWAFESTRPHNSAEMNRITSTIYSFNILSENPKEELWKNLPKLHRLAQGEAQALLEQQMNRQTIQLDLNKTIMTTTTTTASTSSSTPLSQSPTKSNQISPTKKSKKLKPQSTLNYLLSRTSQQEDDEDDNNVTEQDEVIKNKDKFDGEHHQNQNRIVEETNENDGDDNGDINSNYKKINNNDNDNDDDQKNMERFITKSGRMKMRKDLLQYRNTKSSELRPTSRLDKKVNSNLHRDLFLPVEAENLYETISSIDNDNYNDNLSSFNYNRSPTSQRSPNIIYNNGKLNFIFYFNIINLLIN